MHFQISVNQNDDFMTNRLSSAYVKPGHTNVITITPTQQIASEAFRNLPEHKRKCRLKHELYDEKSLFKTYTQQSCEYMCLLRNLSKTQPCVPWDIQDVNNNVTLCHGRKSTHYFRALDAYNPSHDGNCNCPPDCEKISFTAEAAFIPVTPEKDCLGYFGAGQEMPESPYARRMFFTTYERSLRLSSWLNRHFIEHLAKLESPDRWRKSWSYQMFYQSLNHTHLCTKFSLENNVNIIMFIKEPTMIQLIKDVRLSFADKLGIFGGTIGVFTGISFITMIELTYWILIAIIEKCKLIRNKPGYVSEHTMVTKTITPGKVIDITPVEATRTIN